LQVLLLVLFAGANYFGWKVLTGNYSTARVFDWFYLSDPFAALQLFVAGAAASADILVGALIITFIYGVFLGRSFCSWVCPMNLVTDSAAYLRKFIAPDAETKRVNRFTRYLVLGLTLVLSLVFSLAAFEIISPIGMLYRSIIFGTGAGFTYVAAVFLFDLLFKRFGWCGSLCPLGAFYSGISHFRMLKVEHNLDNCTLCMDCKAVCPEIQVLDIIGEKSGYIKSGECTNCARCIEVCNDDALNFKLTFSLQKKQKQ